MTGERWHTVEELYNRAREMEPEGRARYLSKVCAGNESLLREVESLLAEDSRISGFMEDRAVDCLAREFSSVPTETDTPDEDLTGKMLSHYEVVERISAGGMGLVYKAVDLRLGRTVAIKVLPRSSTGDQERLHRFVKEARATSALNHPNIVTIHDIDAVDGVHFIAMEYVRGRTLKEVISKKGLPVREAVGIAIQVAGALAEAHAAGIIHRAIGRTSGTILRVRFHEPFRVAGIHFGFVDIM